MPATLNLINLVVSDEEHKLWSSSSATCSILVKSSLYGLNILLSTLFSNNRTKHTVFKTKRELVMLIEHNYSRQTIRIICPLKIVNREVKKRENFLLQIPRASFKIHQS
jgi:hypothetical protein